MAKVNMNLERLEEEARREMERRLSLWLWKTNWDFATAADVGKLRTFLAEGDHSNLSPDELARVSRFLDEGNFSSMGYDGFIGSFDLNELASIARRNVVDARDVAKIRESRALNAEMGDGSELEIIMDGNGDMVECNWVQRSWGGDVRLTVPADVARMIWENAPLFEPEERESQEEHDAEAQAPAQRP